MCPASQMDPLSQWILSHIPNERTESIRLRLSLSHSNSRHTVERWQVLRSDFFPQLRQSNRATETLGPALLHTSEDGVVPRSVDA